METQILTHSRLSCFRACPRRHYLRYEVGLTKEEQSFALRVGSAFHEAHNAKDEDRDIDAVIDAHLEDPYDKAIVAAMFDAHSRRWEGEDLEVVATELPFEIPLVNPRTGAATPIWRLAGKIDRIVKLTDGRLALMERKTTSRDFSPGADYWVRLHLDQQLSIYVIAARESGYPVDTILYDVTRRPALRPLKATPEEKRKYKVGGALYANQHANDETPPEFAGRVAGEIFDKPNYYFARIEIARLEQDLEDCRSEVWMQQLTIRNAQRDGHWYRNPDSCYEPWACDYLPICQNRDLEDFTPSGYVKVEDVHPELGATQCR